ncbi:MAG TPA: amidase [Solirubrobacteraceae bacterium]|nr:amidase [Solirubrobacteraceae bacterium]
MDALAFLPATELAARIRDGSFTAREAVEAALRRIEAIDPQIGAFVELDAERALTESEGLEPGDRRAFAGVPIAVKASTAVAGLCMNFASRFLAGHRPTHNAYLVRRLREAGFVIVGTTNMSEFGILPTTEPRHTGPTRNPWDTSYTPGGSSGGAAAAVAAGLVPIATGNDGGGSLRIPAACCGLVGLKPSRGRISRGPELGDSYLVSDGVLSRTVAESALLLDVLAGYEPGDATWAPRPAEPYTLAMRRDPGKLRIAMTLANVLDVDADPEVVHGLHSAAELLRDLGHDVVEDSPALPAPDALDIFLQVFGPGIAVGIGLGERLAGRPPEEEEIEPLSRALLEQARALPSTGYLTALAQLQLLARGTVAFFADYDLLLTPVLASRPLPIGELHGCGADPLADLYRSGTFAPYTALFNVTGQPAISVPVGFGEDGLPTAVQLVGHPLGEETLLQLAAQIEIARPWADRRPAVVERV